MQLDAPESPESSDMQEIHSLGVYQSSDTQISKSDMKTITGSSYHVSENIFFDGKKVFTAGSCLQPAVLMSPSPTVLESAVMAPLSSTT